MENLDSNQEPQSGFQGEQSSFFKNKVLWAGLVAFVLTVLVIVAVYLVRADIGLFVGNTSKEDTVSSNEEETIPDFCLNDSCTELKTFSLKDTILLKELGDEFESPYYIRNNIVFYLGDPVGEGTADSASFRVIPVDGAVIAIDDNSLYIKNERFTSVFNDDIRFFSENVYSSAYGENINTSIAFDREDVYLASTFDASYGATSGTFDLWGEESVNDIVLVKANVSLSSKYEQVTPRNREGSIPQDLYMYGLVGKQGAGVVVFSEDLVGRLDRSFSYYEPEPVLRSDVSFLGNDYIRFGSDLMHYDLSTGFFVINEIAGAPIDFDKLSFFDRPSYIDPYIVYKENIYVVDDASTRLVENAETSSFTPAGDGYAADRNYVYLNGNPVGNLPEDLMLNRVDGNDFATIWYFNDSLYEERWKGLPLGYVEYVYSVLGDTQSKDQKDFYIALNMDMLNSALGQLTNSDLMHEYGLALSLGGIDSEYNSYVTKDYGIPVIAVGSNDESTHISEIMGTADHTQKIIFFAFDFQQKNNFSVYELDYSSEGGHIGELYTAEVSKSALGDGEIFSQLVGQTWVSANDAFFLQGRNNDYEDDVVFYDSMLTKLIFENGQTKHIEISDTLYRPRITNYINGSFIVSSDVPGSDSSKKLYAVGEELEKVVDLGVFTGLDLSTLTEGAENDMFVVVYTESKDLTEPRPQILRVNVFNGQREVVTVLEEGTVVRDHRFIPWNNEITFEVIDRDCLAHGLYWEQTRGYVSEDAKRFDPHCEDYFDAWHQGERRYIQVE